MILYSEDKNRKLSTFKKSVISENGDIISQQEVTCPMYFMEKYDFTYIILYDDNMVPIRDAFRYLNYDLHNCPITTRRNAAHAIRFLYCYLSLSGHSINNVDQMAFDGLKSFLRGVDSGNEKFSIKTIRSGTTVNAYFSIYRAYFKKCNINCPALFKSHSIKTECEMENEYSITENRIVYDNNAKICSSEPAEVPKYISPEEFKKLYSLAIKNNDKTAMLIMHLMYGYGLRLGEVLGITIEDIKEIHNNGTLTPVIILRNRISDKSFQFAKRLMHATSKQQYRSDMEYKKSKTTIHITYELYEDLINYVNDYHEEMLTKYPENYEEGVADIVSYRDIPEYNHYVFLNQYGKILSDQTWNNKLKKYFKEAGIIIDYGIKKDNLGHRFRHGFAMFHAHFSENPVDIYKLKKMMRHKRFSSTMVYYNPTAEEIMKIKTEFQNELYKLIPELKSSFRGDNND